ncbi:GNAT family N-acetyltransferase [bacterium]|nr:GNAT family N-acetyltransferase [bacterium]
MITFKANYLTTNYIPKVNPKESNLTQRVSFVSFNLKDKNDLQTLKNLSRNWLGKSFAFRIYDDFKNHSKAPLKEYPLYFYGLTLQQDNFEKLDPKLMLGIAEAAPLIDDTFNTFCDFYTYNDCEINFIQANPKSKYPNYSNGYKDIGKMLINCISNVFSNSNIWVAPAADAIGFYEKLGFESFPGILEMVLKKGSQLIKK